MTQEAESAIAFLQLLRPGGPWLLTAIVPDGPTTTITASSAEKAREFIKEHNGLRNIFYSVNPVRAPMTKKAAKIDIAAIEFLLADLDPNDDEAPERAKARFREALAAEPEPSALIDSGNGLQVLWRLANGMFQSNLPKPAGSIEEEMQLYQ